MKWYKLAGMVGMLVICVIPLAGCREESDTSDTEGVTSVPTKVENTTMETSTETPTELTTEPTLEPTTETTPKGKREAANAIVVDDPLLDLEPDEFAEEYAKLPDDYKIHIGDKDNVTFSFLGKNYGRVLKMIDEGDGTITKKQAEKVTQIIMLYADEVVDDMDETSLSLKGLRYFQNVSAITMELKILSSYSEFNYLKSLVKVSLSSCEFEKEGETEELGCLFSMQGMDEIYLGDGLTNVNFLSGCSDLGDLHVALGGEFSDISGLSSLERVGYLKLTSEHLTDISALSNLTEVDELDLSSNNIADISALSNLTEVNKLDLSYNQISDITPLSNLTEVASLLLFNNQIADITPLSGLRKVHEIGLSDNPITDISPLRNLEFVKSESILDSEPGLFLENLDIDNDLAREMFGDYCYGLEE